MDLMDSAGVSELTGISAATLRYWRHVNEGPPSFKLGRRVVYRREAVEEWVAEQERATQRGDKAAV